MVDVVEVEAVVAAGVEEQRAPAAPQVRVEPQRVEEQPVVRLHFRQPAELRNWQEAQLPQRDNAAERVALGEDVGPEVVEEVAVDVGEPEQLPHLRIRAT